MLDVGQIGYSMRIQHINQHPKSKIQHPGFNVMQTSSKVIGKVVQVAGPAVDCEFDEGQIPPIHTAIRITSEGFDAPDPIDIICETEQHIGEGRVRTIALQPTEGLVRGMKAESLGTPVMVPVGKETLGRVLNVI